MNAARQSPTHPPGSGLQMARCWCLHPHCAPQLGEAAGEAAGPSPCWCGGRAAGCRWLGVQLGPAGPLHPGIPSCSREWVPCGWMAGPLRRKGRRAQKPGAAPDAGRKGSWAGLLRGEKGPTRQQLGAPCSGRTRKVEQQCRRNGSAAQKAVRMALLNQGAVLLPHTMLVHRLPAHGVALMEAQGSLCTRLPPAQQSLDMWETQAWSRCARQKYS